ncbi:NAD(P)/FAD-dependent oxidoreductase [Niveispirillum sp. KHB5.9]|uniref:NAD(P)/FAD-dependent oxidoreductase n=1 Tax=Niveispirillum sp. KHB5.9 TaxID=3400269 RepID=UPI003A8AFF7F
MADGLVIIGGSYAAANIAAAAREAGYQEPIRLVSAEPHLPYQRPPLSKGYLSGKVEASALPLRAESWYRETGVELLLGSAATALDRGAGRVVLADGRQLSYGKLALATGARPRPLTVPGAGLRGVLGLRDLADADAIRDRMGAVDRVVIIGGGFIGLEIAATLALAGRHVTVLEAQDRLLARAVAPVLSNFLASVHRDNGVIFRFGARVTGLVGDAGHVVGVCLADGDILPAGLVLVGIGALPNQELAQAAGLACNDGILVDAAARTGDPAIVAAGDCTRHPNPHAGGGLIRLESVQHANDQAKVAGAAVAGQPRTYDAVPWFWSDQYGFKLQMAGLARGADMSVPRGMIRDGKFSLFHFRGGQLVAVESVNRPGDHIQARRLLAAGLSPTPAQAGDADFDLKALSARQAG